MNSMEEYMKELNHLKSLGVLPKEQIEELDKIMKTMEGIEKKIDYSEFNLPIKFVNKSDNVDPTWAKDGDSGLDLRANIKRTMFKYPANTEVSGSFVLEPRKRALIPTGLHFEVPTGYDIEIKSRSGLALKNGIAVLTGTIDQNYRGEINVLLYNSGDEDFVINHGDRIAQAVIRPVVTNSFGKMVRVESVEELEETSRGAGGFGSTGKN